MAGRLAGAVLMLNVLACLRPDRADGGQKGEPPFGSSAQDRRGASASAHPSGRGAGLSRPDSAEELAELDRRLQEVERLEEMAWAAVRGAKFGLADRLARQAPESVSPYLLAAVAAGSGRRREALDRFEEGLFANAAPPRDSLAPLVGSGLLPFLVDRLAALSRGPGGPALATLQWSLHGGDLFDHAAEVGMARLRLVDGDERARICFEVACNLARGSVPETALVRLTDAVEGGFASGEILDLEPDLDSLRSLEGYQRVRAQLD
jgi:hypothetical protein